MAKKILSYLCIYIILTADVIAQNITFNENFNNTLTLNIGVNDFHIKDERISPLIFRGILFSSYTSYKYRDNKFTHDVETFISLGKIFSTFNQNLVEQFAGCISYSLLHQIYNVDYANSNINLNLGAGIKSFVSYENTLDPNYFILSGEDSWYWSHSLNLIFSGVYNIVNKHSINFQLSSPFIRTVSRPDFSQNQLYYEVESNHLKAAKYGDIEFLWNDFVIFSNLSYVYNQSKHIGLNISYNFYYASTHKTQFMGLYSNNFLLGGGWQF